MTLIGYPMMCEQSLHGSLLSAQTGARPGCWRG